MGTSQSQRAVACLLSVFPSFLQEQSRSAPGSTLTSPLPSRRSAQASDRSTNLLPKIDGSHKPVEHIPAEPTTNSLQMKTLGYLSTPEHCPGQHIHICAHCTHGGVLAYRLQLRVHLIFLEVNCHFFLFWKRIIIGEFADMFR